MGPSTTFAPDDWRSQSPDFSGETLRRNLAVVDTLKEFAAARDVSLPALAVAWAIGNPMVDVAIFGATNREQLDDTVRAVDVRLSRDDIGAIDRILADAMPMHGPRPEGMPSSSDQAL
jgi:hypothetical protein